MTRHAKTPNIKHKLWGGVPMFIRLLSATVAVAITPAFARCTGGEI
jgi:hypothetical protein